ncbi:MAG TPA: hypothetical protein VMT27_09595 [Actinomycetes bacterium]|nr:hypothetical protein [Actinomycetes bacterium]
MKTNRYAWPAVAFAVGVVAIGISYWPIAYDDVELPSSVMGPGMFVVFLLATALRGWANSAFWLSLVAAGSAVPAAVAIRVFVDVLSDPTSHNLWLFEVAIAMFVGGVVALLGATAGELVHRARSTA